MPRWKWSAHRLDTWWTVLPLVGLVTVVATVVGTSEHALVITGTAAVLTLWHYWWIYRHPQWWETAMVPMAVYFIGAVALLSVLTALHPRFVIVALTWYPMAFVALPGAWSYPGVLVLATITIPGGPPNFDTGIAQPGDYTFGVAGALLVCVIGFMVRALDRQSSRRGELNTELEQANRDLVELARQKEALQTELIDQARHRGIHDERARITGELHDTLAQALAGIVTQLETAEALDETTSQPVLRRISSARDLARANLVELRRSLNAMRPEALEKAGLVEAVQQVVTAQSGAATIEFTVTGDVKPIPADVETVLLRAAQEAIINVVKHAAAHRVGVTLSFMDDVVVLDIRDDGRGFDEQKSGLGLTSMRERVERIGGAMRIESSHAGTALNVTIPWSSA